MGILSDLFVSTHEDASLYQERYLARALKSSAYQRVEYKGITDLELGTLWAVVQGDEWDINVHRLNQVAFGAGGETWLFRFPDAFVRSLQSLDEARISRASELWASTEELKCAPTYLMPVVSDLNRLSKLATGDKGLFLWGSL